VELAGRYGVDKVVRRITMKGLMGEIDWKKGLMLRISLLSDKMRKDDAEEAALRLPLMDGAKETCSRLRRMGFSIAAISGGFQFLAERVKKELELDLVISNKLLFNDYGRFKGVIIEVDSDKASVLMHYLGQRVVDVAVVDGANDLTIFNIAEVKIAFNAAPIVESKADVSIKKKNLVEILKYIKPYPTQHYLAA
jgi:phosphoserine phosphatase